MSIVKITNVKKSDIVKINGDYYKISNVMTSKPGKGGAYCTITAKNLINQKKIEKRFSTSDDIDKIQVHTKILTFEYLSGINMAMYNDFGEEFEFPYDNKIIKEGMEVSAICDEENNILQVFPPKELKYQVISVSGRSSDATKEQNVTVNDGIMIKCPNYVKVGQTIIVKGEDLSFIGVDR